MGRLKKNERFSVKAGKYRSGTPYWTVSGTKKSGDRVRKFHLSRAQALEHKNELELEYEGAHSEAILRKTTLSEAQLSDAAVAYGAAGDKSVAWIVQQYLELEQRLIQHDSTLPKAIKFFEEHYRPEIVEIRLDDAAERFLQAKSKLRPKTLAYYKSCLVLLLKQFENLAMHRIGISEVELVLAPFDNPNTLATYRRGMDAFFNWGIRHHHVLENPCSRLDPVPTDNTHIAVLSLEEVKRLLTATILYAESSMAPVIAIALFSGLRPSEIEELEVTDIKDEFIAVTRGKMRRKIKRRAPITEPLNQWLKEFPFQGMPKGYAYKLKQLKKATDAENWKQDVLRHTSVTYQLERDEDEARTALNNGTSREMINRHYRDVLENPAHRDEFWSLTPKVIRNLAIDVTLPTSQGTIWPSDTLLAKIVLQKPLTHIAKDLGVSDNAVRKHCMSRGIKLPQNGYWQRRGAI